ncbi:HlyD family secretion protein [Altererythrobacter atlanticus]|uniref:Macrolide export protein MacA n=1 Tax=Croceibacterium atlanticum TaxID=1267766 RepID=A0A0F7KR84_9SPHN|nr:efflux RND transporter periplasmic adaptor subunit [Croceibacterium atlanticum]AKH42114.1 Macrolide export protein MacA [Croceibacterium atlanticum]MBB5733316.1 HlyD family secretion protein [Croceibacterium atlanticum]
MMLHFLKRWRWAISIAAIMLAGFVYAFWPTSLSVDVATVSRGAMHVGVTDDGVTRAEEYYVVSAPVTGYLDRIELEAGDRVEPGALITTMRGRPATPLDRRSAEELRGALAAARASVSSAEATLGQARRDLARAEELARRGFLPRAQLEATRTRVATAEGALAQGRAEAARIRAAMGQPSAAGAVQVPVYSPAGGSVMSVINESEGVILEGTQLMTIGDPDRIEAVVDLLSREAVRISPGDPVRISQWGGAEPLMGRVERIEPFGRLKISALGIEEQRVNVIISFTEASRSAAARLGHGYQIDATIILWSSDDALRLPIGAMFRGGDGEWRVFVDDGGRAREREIVIGHLNDEFAEVLSGLDEGETVILNPGNALEDGDPISIRR